jgi:hypothetical protein
LRTEGESPTDSVNEFDNKNEITVNSYGLQKEGLKFLASKKNVPREFNTMDFSFFAIAEYTSLPTPQLEFLKLMN